jgi:cell division protein FtsQ
MADSVRKTAKKRKAKRSGGSRAQQPTPAVIYTEPKTFNRNRFLVQMVTVVAVVVAFVLALSVFFKVETITVTGADVYSAWAIREASGISEGDNLLTFSHARAGAQIMANLPYVNTVRFGIKLPGTVNIIVEEAEVVYAIKDANGQWWLMNSSGRVVEQTDSGVAANYTQVLGVTLESPAVNLQAVAAEAAPTETDASGEFIPVTVTGALRLNTAMQILKALETNDIVGEAASVDVTRIEDIILWYGTRYQVNLGDSSRLDYKIDCMNDVILQMSEYQSGILDISFKHWTDQVGYTPFA